MSQLEVSESHYDHVFWAMAVAVSLVVWTLTIQAPAFAYLAGDAILTAVLVGWLTAMWRGPRFAGAVGGPRPRLVPASSGS